MSIYIYGTSHVSEDSLELVEEKIEAIEPDFVALELDINRLNALLSDQDRKGGPAFIRLIKKFQDFVGSQTGVMPGEEMLFAYEKAVEDDIEVALIDQDISITVNKLKQVRMSEKVKAITQLLIGVLIPGTMDYTEIPEEEFLERLLFEFKFKFPGLYNVLVEDRNRHMTGALEQLQEQNHESDIVAFVGAAHRRSIEESLDLHGY